MCVACWEANVAVLMFFSLFIFVKFSQGRKVKCSTSQAKHKLFIGNVPRNWGEEDMKKVVNKVGPGVVTVELLKVRMLFYFGIIDILALF